MYTKFVILFLSILPIYFLLDAFLCGKVFARFYGASLESVRGRLKPASIATYLFTVLLLLLIVIVPALERVSFLYTLLAGALFGTVVQTLFNLLRSVHEGIGGTTDNDADAPLYIDIVRGALLGSSVSVFGYGVGVVFEIVMRTVS
jgi:uncharacterized membrane protein